MKKYFCIILYKLFAYYLPRSTFPILGKISKRIRYNFAKCIFKRIGKNVNIEKGARFGLGNNIQIGDNSGIGFRSSIPSDTIIGNDVMMGPNVIIFASNHKYDRIDIPMNIQGTSMSKQTIIEDDVWIGSHVIMTPGRTIRKGTIIATGTVLIKDFPAYSIIGGNPSQLIKRRL